jgi:DnaJ-domain-containing protein 1
VSIKDRVVDRVGSLFHRLNEGDAVSGVDPEELEKELTKRVAARKAAGSPTPAKNARARLAQAGEKARQQRIALAAKRVARIHARRTKKAAARKREQDAAFRNMAEEARRNPPPDPTYSSSRSSSTRSGSGARSSSRRPSIFQNKDMAQHYKTLNVEYGADAKTVKKSYRKLMRKFHPDLHIDPRKKKAATQLTVKISAAYTAIEKHRKQ